MDEYLSGQYALQSEQERDFMRKVHRYALKQQGLLLAGVPERVFELNEERGGFLVPYVTGDVGILRLYMAVQVTDCIRAGFESGIPRFICEDLKKAAYTDITRANSAEELSNVEQKLLASLAQSMRRFHVADYSLTVRRAIEFIHNSTFQPLSARDVAAHLQVEQTHLSKHFHREVGMTITDYIRKVKIDAADYLIGQREYSLTEIADLLGYSRSYFSKVYKKERGHAAGSVFHANVL